MLSRFFPDAPTFSRLPRVILNAILFGAAIGPFVSLLLAWVLQAPWDRIFREFILPDENDPKQRDAGEFLRSRVSDLDRLTVDVSNGPGFVADWIMMVPAGSPAQTWSTQYKYLSGSRTPPASAPTELPSISAQTGSLATTRCSTLARSPTP